MAPKSTAPLANPTNSSMGNGYTAGFGFGLKSRWLRTDVTIDYATPTKYKGTIASADDTAAKVQPTTALLNGYLDLGTWYHIAAYIGGGAGVAYNRITDYRHRGAAVDRRLQQESMEFRLCRHGGHRLSHFAQSDDGCRIPLPQCRRCQDRRRRASAAMTIKNVAAHEVRVGLRWSFDDFR